MEDKNEVICVTDSEGKVLYWCHADHWEEHSKAIKEFSEKMTNALLWGRSEPHIPKEDDNVKLAYVKKDGKQVLLGVDNKTLKGYELEETIPTWKRPIIETDYQEFVRWARLMDL